jgi:hypothetical protein
LEGLVLAVLLFGAGCGYVGPVQPPSPQIPATITDLAVVERGDQLVVTFNTPPRTTDSVAITRFSDIDLRVGPADQSPESAKAYDAELPPPSDKEDPQPHPVSVSIPVSDWSGQRISVQVRTEVKKKGHFSAWSNKISIQVIAPLQPPVVQAAGSADGIVLTWPVVDGLQYRVQRQGPNDKLPVEVATVDTGTYVDASAQYDTKYSYVVTAKKGAAESVPSEAFVLSVADKFAPEVPKGLSVLAGPDEVNLAWQRNTESDLQGYYVYRSNNGGPFERQGGLVALPLYTDHQVEHGKTYSYKISSVDKKGNESAQSAPAEVQY